MNTSNICSECLAFQNHHKTHKHLKLLSSISFERIYLCKKCHSFWFENEKEVELIIQDEQEKSA